MNILPLFNRIKRKLLNLIQDILFFSCLYPLYKIDFAFGGNRFCCKGFMRSCSVRCSGGGNLVHIENGCLLNRVLIEISGHGNKLIIHRGARFLEGGRIRIEDSCNTVEIGENSSLINCFLSSADKNTIMKVGKNCLISTDVIIRTSDAHSIMSQQSNERINFGANVIVGDHVWICNGVRIMKGSTINSDCIIGGDTIIAGQHIDRNCLVVGNPGKVVKSGVNWDISRI